MKNKFEKLLDELRDFMKTKFIITLYFIYVSYMFLSILLEFGFYPWASFVFLIVVSLSFFIQLVIPLFIIKKMFQYTRKRWKKLNV